MEGQVHPRPIWSFVDVKDRLIEAAEIQRRMDSGRWPFASDGPWHLIVEDKRAWDWDADGWEQLPVPKLRPSRDQIARSEEATGWLRFVRETDRRLVVMAVTALACGQGRVPWARLVRPMGETRGPDALRMRFNRAITAICNGLNAAEMRA